MCLSAGARPQGTLCAAAAILTITHLLPSQEARLLVATAYRHTEQVLRNNLDKLHAVSLCCPRPHACQELGPLSLHTDAATHPSQKTT